MIRKQLLFLVSALFGLLLFTPRGLNAQALGELGQNSFCEEVTFGNIEDVAHRVINRYGANINSTFLDITTFLREELERGTYSNVILPPTIRSSKGTGLFRDFTWEDRGSGMEKLGVNALNLSWISNRRGFVDIEETNFSLGFSEDQFEHKWMYAFFRSDSRARGRMHIIIIDRDISFCGSAPEGLAHPKKSLSAPVFKIFPNPTTDLLSLQLNLKKSEEVSVQVLDLFGSVLMQPFQAVRLESAREELSIDLSDLNDGPYLVYLRMGNKVVTEKIYKGSY